VFLFRGKGNDPTSVLSKLHREDAALRAENEVDNVATAHRFGSVREMTPAAPNAAQETRAPRPFDCCSTIVRPTVALSRATKCLWPRSEAD
jgi:hypothetical protein